MNQKKGKTDGCLFRGGCHHRPPQSYAEYSKQVGPMVARYGRNTPGARRRTSTIEGDRQPQRLVVIEVADTEHFRGWYDSTEYAEVRTIRFKASTARAVLAQGTEQR